VVHFESPVPGDAREMESLVTGLANAAL